MSITIGKNTEKNDRLSFTIVNWHQTADLVLLPCLNDDKTDDPMQFTFVKQGKTIGRARFPMVNDGKTADPLPFTFVKRGKTVDLVPFTFPAACRSVLWRCLVLPFESRAYKCCPQSMVCAVVLAIVGSVGVSGAVFKKLSRPCL